MLHAPYMPHVRSPQTTIHVSHVLVDHTCSVCSLVCCISVEGSKHRVLCVLSFYKSLMSRMVVWLDNGILFLTLFYEYLSEEHIWSNYCNILPLQNFQAHNVVRAVQQLPWEHTCAYSKQQTIFQMLLLLYRSVFPTSM